MLQVYALRHARHNEIPADAGKLAGIRQRLVCDCDVFSGWQQPNTAPRNQKLCLMQLFGKSVAKLAGVQKAQVQGMKSQKAHDFCYAKRNDHHALERQAGK